MLRDAVLALRNKDGGWPYYRGRASRLEPTCWALLALAREARVTPDLTAVARWPQYEGWMVDVPGVSINYGFNALAALTLLQDPKGVEPARRLATKLLEVRGITVEPAPMIRQDNSLQAWPWIDGTFSWVEPTALCLLLLKHRAANMRGPGADRIRVGEQVLTDRVCRDGGWNYGGSNVYGQELFPYVPTTALGLLAMQDRREDPAVVRSLAHLRKDLVNERSAVALALAVIALRVYGAPTDEAHTLLAAALPASETIGSTLGMAMGLYAMTGAQDGDAAFTI